jgi:hypothetical protein
VCYTIKPEHGAPFQSYCWTGRDDQGRDTDRYCYTTQGKAWIDRDDGKGGWKTVKKLRDGFPKGY